MGIAMTPPTIAARGTARNGLTPLMAKYNTPYPPRPTKACWPIDTMPAYPARRFHIVAMINSTKKFTSIETNAWGKIQGAAVNATTSPITPTNVAIP